MPLTLQELDQLVIRFRKERARYQKLAETVGAICRRLVDDLPVRAAVTWRVKDPERLREKLLHADQASLYSTVDSVFVGMKDLAGVRVATYAERDRARVVGAIVDRFAGRAEGGKPQVKEMDQREAGRHYRATHCQVVIHKQDLLPSISDLSDDWCEIQVCSLLAHVFNEVEHDLVYKPQSGAVSEAEKQLIDQLGMLARAGDLLIELLLERSAERLQENRGAFLDVHDFIARMREFFPAPAPGGGLADLFSVCVSLGLTTREAVRELVESTKAAVAAKASAFAASIKDDPILRLDGSDSDGLLLALLEGHGQAICEGPAARERPPRMVELAKLWRQLGNSEVRND